MLPSNPPKAALLGPPKLPRKPPPFWMSGKGRRPQALKLSGVRGLTVPPLTTARPQDKPVEMLVVGTTSPTKELLGRWTEKGHVSPCQLLCLVLSLTFYPHRTCRRRGGRDRAGPGEGQGSTLSHASCHHWLYENEQVDKCTCLDNARG